MSMQSDLEVFGFSTKGELKPDAVKQRYHDLALQHHPDRGGDAAYFAELVRIYKRLAKFADRCPVCLDSGKVLVRRGLYEIEELCPECVKKKGLVHDDPFTHRRMGRMYANRRKVAKK